MSFSNFYVITTDISTYALYIIDFCGPHKLYIAVFHGGPRGDVTMDKKWMTRTGFNSACCTSSVNSIELLTACICESSPIGYDHYNNH